MKHFFAISIFGLFILACDNPKAKESPTQNSNSQESPSPTPTPSPSPSPSPSVFTPTSFTDVVETWDQSFDACSVSNNGNMFWQWTLQGREPSEEGRFPVYIHLVGTGDVETNPYAIEMIQKMSAKGFVAASVPYDSFGGLGGLIGNSSQSCTLLSKKAQCIFGNRPGSAVSKLCARAKADCSRGIVVSGHSQGSWISLAAKDVDSRVRAAYLLGSGYELNVYNFVYIDLSACLLPGSRALPADRVRIVNGESENIYNVDMVTEIKGLTSMNCSGLECLRANGSGYTYFPNSASETDTNDVVNGPLVARHCYFANTPPGDCGGTYQGLNSNWSTGNFSYSLGPNLNWLSSFVDQ